MAFEPSARTRKKSTASASRLLEPGVAIREYVVGRAHARMTSGATVALIVFAMVFVAALLAGQIIFPGLLLILIVYNSVLPPRGIVVANQGLALLERSFLNGRPKKVLALLPFAALDPFTTQVKGSKVIVPLAKRSGHILPQGVRSPYRGGQRRRRRGLGADVMHRLNDRAGLISR